MLKRIMVVWKELTETQQMLLELENHKLQRREKLELQEVLERHKFMTGQKLPIFSTMVSSQMNLLTLLIQSNTIILSLDLKKSLMKSTDQII